MVAAGLIIYQPCQGIAAGHIPRGATYRTGVCLMKAITTYILTAIALTTPVNALAQAGPVGAPGRYVIVHSPHIQGDTVLLDTVTGRTWLLVQDSSRNDDPTYWTPMAREDNPSEMNMFLQNHPAKK